MTKSVHGIKSRRRKGSRRKSTKRPAGAGRWLLFAAKWTATLTVWAVIAAGMAAAWYAYDLPDVDSAVVATRRPSVSVLATDGSTIATYGDLHGAPVQLADLPVALPQAVLATEDRRFYSHFGLDVIGLARATLANIRAGRIVEGGSTITQQVAKNLFLTPARTIKRKVQELMLALWLERKFTKDQILTLYLNRVYLGAGTYGVEAAARRYFGIPPRRLSLYQAATLAGLLKAPSRYNPIRDAKKAAARTRIVLANMVAAGYLSPAEAKRAEQHRSGTAKTAPGGRAGRYFADWIVEQVSAYVTRGNRDLTVVTTLDAALQRKAESAVEKTLAGPGASVDASQAALLALGPDGAVRAMVGGRDYRKSQFNRATQARRQPGSAFKPFVYLAALEAGLTPDTRLVDEPVTIEGWSPRNFNGRHRGEVTLRQAMAQSINTVAVTAAEWTGRGRVVETARRLGITAALRPTPSLALGVTEVGLMELTASYAPFANGGIGVWAYGIEEIRDTRGHVFYRRAGSGPGRAVKTAHVAAMNDMLGAVVATGTGRAAALGRPAAGKTGTSQNFRDAWFVGYSADLIAGVWMGNDDGRPMRKVTGGGLPARLWRDFMKSAHQGVAARPLPGRRAASAPGDDQQGFWSGLIARFAGGAG
jgi:penicillin-binding protein 1A